jgi:hypothetical protein
MYRAEVLRNVNLELFPLWYDLMFLLYHKENNQYNFIGKELNNG